MLKQIHEATGSISQSLIIFLAVAGLCIYQFKHVRIYLQKINISRKQLVTLHKIAAVILIPAVIVHYYTTDKTNIFVIISAVGALLLVPYGLLFRVKSLKSTHFQKMAVIKIIILAVFMTFALIGHDSLDKQKHKETALLQ